MVIVNAIACYGFVSTTNIWVLYAIRFILGFTQAFVVIHGPVWVNEFAPHESSSKWLAMLHGAVVVGILGGYLVTAIFENYFSPDLNWATSIEIQAYAQLALGVIALFFVNMNLDADI